MTTYSGWQRERSGWIGDLSGAGAALVALGAISGMVPLYARSLLAFALFGPLSVVLIGLAYGRVYGLTADQWALLALRHHIAVVRGQHMFLSGAFAPRKRTDGSQPLDLPGTLARLRILTAPDGRGSNLGVAHDPAAGTYTAVLQVHHGGLALVDQHRQDARVDGWAAVLRALCVDDGPIVRISVHERCLPDDGTALASWTAGQIDMDAPRAAVDNLRALTQGVGPSAAARETYISLTLSAARARTAIRSAGDGQVGACAVLVQQLQAMEAQLPGAGLTVAQRLTPRGLAGVIRSAYDPEEQLASSARAAAEAQGAGWAGTPSGVDPAAAGPAAALTSWQSYRHDGAQTVTYAIGELPRQRVFATNLLSILAPRPNARRVLTVIYEPLGPRAARRTLSREQTKREADRSLRRRTGRRESIDEQRAAERARAQDVARADGEGVVRVTGLVAVTVTDDAELDSACADLQADASQAALTLRRLWGGQDAGFAAAVLPLGTGLPNPRGMI